MQVVQFPVIFNTFLNGKSLKFSDVFTLTQNLTPSCQLILRIFEWIYMPNNSPSRNYNCSRQYIKNPGSARILNFTSTTILVRFRSTDFKNFSGFESGRDIPLRMNK